jgi:NAD(P)-dependent dehydrogenase (short-subunit alcohol dehydrogenase family)
MELGLAGRRALVTGGTRGIGRAIADTLAAEGADVGVCARGAEGVAATVDALRRAGVRATGRALDVGDGPALRAWIAGAAAELGGLDVLVANASALVGEGEESWRRSFAVDLMGTVHAVEAATPLLERSSAGSIVLVGTTSIVEPFGPPTSYAALKSALPNYAKSVAHALAPAGVRCNVVSPGPIFFPGGSWDTIRRTMPDLYERTLAAMPIGRLGTPEEVARVVAFLASPVASLVTGAHVIVDGGFTRRV